MFDIPERETEAFEKKQPAAAHKATPMPLGTLCQLCERYPGGPATGWRMSEVTRMCATGRPKPDHQRSVVITSATHCVCSVGRWLASTSEAQKVAMRLARGRTA